MFVENIYMEENLTLERLIEFAFEQAKLKQERDSRRMVLGTGKSGAIEYLKSVWSQAGLSEDKIVSNTKEAEEHMKNGVYMIDSNNFDNLGITYYGVK